MARKPSTKATPAKIERPKRVIPKKTATHASSTSSSSSSARRSTSTKTKKTASKKATKTDRKTKPTYERMIFKALKDLGSRTHHSTIAICKYIEANYPVPETTFKRSVRLAIHKAVEDGKLRQHRASYRVTAKALESSSRAKSTSKRSKSPSRSKSSSSSSSTSDGKKRKRASAAKEEAPKKRSTKNSAKTSDTIEKPKKRSTAKSSSTKSSSPKSPSKSSSKRSSKTSSGSSESSSSSSAPSSIARPSGLKSDHIWQYDDKGWKNYEAEASDVVEDVYQNYLANRGDTDVRAVKSGQWEYMVDFMAMKQTNIQHDNHTIRNIRRVPISG